MFQYDKEHHTDPIVAIDDLELVSEDPFYNVDQTIHRVTDPEGKPDSLHSEPTDIICGTAATAYCSHDTLSDAPRSHHKDGECQTDSHDKDCRCQTSSHYKDCHCQTSSYRDGNKAAPDNNLFFEERSNPLSSKGN